MKSVTIALGGKQTNLKMTWGMIKETAQTVADPLFISREIMKEELFKQQGIPYQAGFSFGVVNSCEIVAIALRENGKDVSADDVGEYVTTDGIHAIENAAQEIILAMMGGGPEVKDESGKAEAPKAG